MSVDHTMSTSIFTFLNSAQVVYVVLYFACEFCLCCSQPEPDITQSTGLTYVPQGNHFSDVFAVSASSKPAFLILKELNKTEDVPHVIKLAEKCSRSIQWSSHLQNIFLTDDTKEVCPYHIGTRVAHSNTTSVIVLSPDAVHIYSAIIHIKDSQFSIPQPKVIPLTFGYFYSVPVKTLWRGASHSKGVWVTHDIHIACNFRHQDCHVIQHKLSPKFSSENPSYASAVSVRKQSPACIEMKPPFGDTRNHLRFVSWNVGGGWDEGVAWDERLDGVISTLKDIDADVIALQEVRFSGDCLSSFCQDKGSHMLTHIQQGLHTLYPFFVFSPAAAFLPGQYGIRSEEGVAILSKFPIVRTFHVWLPRNSSDDANQRILLIAQIQVPEIITVAVTHLTFEDSARSFQAQHVKDYLMSEVLGPIILAGDMNAEPGDTAVEIFRDGFMDTHQLHECPQDMKCCACTFPSEHPEKRIDYVFTRDVLPSSSSHDGDVPQNRVILKLLKSSTASICVELSEMKFISDDHQNTPTPENEGNRVETTVREIGSREGMGVFADSLFCFSDHLPVLRDFDLVITSGA